MTDAPERIYVTLSTWFSRRTGRDDVEYLRYDIHKRELREAWIARGKYSLPHFEGDLCDEGFAAFLKSKEKP